MAPSNKSNGQRRSITKTRVSVAIIYNQQQQILITRRAYTATHPGKWELPGGKIFINETDEQALYREIKEEVGLKILTCKLVTQLEYSYPQKHVELNVFKVTKYQGNAKPLENQLSLKWVAPHLLKKYDFLEANYPIIDLI